MGLGGLVASRRELVIFLSTVVVWSAMMIAVGFYAAGVANRSAETLALHQARTLFHTITDFRRWASQHGGVYVLTNDKVKPNPYLPADKRTIRDEKGRELTLVNPSLMTRQAAELIGRRRNGVVVHLTSLHPIRKRNAPRPWERATLESFERGTAAYAGFYGEREFRFMAPLKTEKSCLGCHPKEHIGSVRGGVSITIGAGPFVQARTAQQRNVAAVLGVIWLMGMVLIAFFVRLFRRGEQQLNQAEEMSCQDPLTSLRNRRGFFAFAQQAILAMDGPRDRATLLFIDVDSFKELNDLYGHGEGDAALQRIAEILRETFRDTDVLGRLGGDEFVVLMLHADQAERDKARQRLERAVAQSNSIADKPYALSLSVGSVVFSPSEERSLQRLIENADRAMYDAKRIHHSGDALPAVGRHSA